MKRPVITIFLLICFAAMALAWFSFSGTGKRITSLHFPKKEKVLPVLPNSLLKINIKASDARSFLTREGYNTSVCFLIDMNLPSGQKRFFVYDLARDSIINSGLVTHGRCNEDWLEGRRYNNVVGGGCTSLGKYRIGKPYQGRFGLAYKLYGLEPTNSQAYRRYVVLHSHDCVPENPVAGEICQSDGCPTVSPGFLKEVQSIIDRSKKPILLWIFE